MKYITPNLESERLILKRGPLEDYLKVYEYDFTKLRDIAGEFEFIKQDLEEISGFDTYADENEDVLDWIIYSKENNIPIGNIVADRVNKDNNSIEISYNLHPNYWGKGYMKEAALAVMNYLYSLGFDNIICGYDEGNIKSKKLIDKIGFSPYQIKENAWSKNGIPITTYITIMNKDTFYTMYSHIDSQNKKR